MIAAKHLGNFSTEGCVLSRWQVEPTITSTPADMIMLAHIKTDITQWYLGG
jgi:hypothetical protein